MGYYLTELARTAIETGNETWQQLEHDERAMLLCQYILGRDLLWEVFKALEPAVLEEWRVGATQAVRDGREPIEYFNDLQCRVLN